jgi:two-component system response regulator RegA
MADMPLLVIVEDDPAFSRTLARSFERRGYRLRIAASHDALLVILTECTPDFAVVDLKLNGVSGLVCVQALHQHAAAMVIVVLTGFASIATAVEAIKLGASQYLAKPSNTDDIEAAFGRVAGNAGTPLTTRSTSIKTVEWEHIHQVLADTNFNISEAARRLGMHRRTLARKLDKYQIR